MKHYTTMKRVFFPALLSAFLLFWALLGSAADDAAPSADQPVSAEAVAIFAGGCFWCMEPPFDKLPGVLSTTSGYTDGHKANPGYKEVSAGTTGHTEAVEIRYDPGQVTYSTLLEVFWRNIDPFAVDRQFCDRGSQYRSGIYYRNDEERELAEAGAKAISERFGKPVATEVKPATRFYPAEDYHQDYYEKNPLRYKFYRRGCGRDKRLQEIWG
jgi:peptide-methionine (S)-S-oxide reductase